MGVVGDRTLLETLVRREPITDGPGLSGAVLERGWLADGSSVVLKRQSPATDLFLKLLGDEHGRELDLFHAGVLDRLPSELGHAVLGGFVDGDETVIVMRDLGDRMLTWDDRLDASATRRLAAGVAALHRVFHGEPPDGLSPLPVLVATFAPGRLLAVEQAQHPLVRAVLDGWSCFADLVDPAVTDAVLALLEDPTPLVAALERCTPTLCHGDLATVNLAWEDTGPTVIDWGQAVAAPGELDITRLLCQSTRQLGLGRDEFLAAYREAAPATFDARALDLGFLAGLLWLGWDKARGATRDPDPQRRDWERADLAWWVARSRRVLAGGL